MSSASAEQQSESKHRSPEIFSIENTATGDYRTFKLETQPEDADFAPGNVILSLLIGRTEYKAFAFCGEPRGVFEVFCWKRFKDTELENHGGLVGAVIDGGGCYVTVSGTKYRRVDAVCCSRCGELLTRPDSIRKGIGPICETR